MTLDQAFNTLAQNYHSTLVPQVITILITVSPIVLAALLFTIAWKLWVDYIRVKFFYSLKYTVLELRLPLETNKSPLAMETVLHGLHNTSDGNFWAMFWKGEVRPWYSLEIVSLGGQVKFMIWTEDRRKAGLMATLYAQYPGIEIYEREDYAKAVHFDPKVVKTWAAEFKMAKDDPYPIKTYVDYGLDKDPKEEFKVDPLSNVIEYLGTVPPDAQMWFQFIIRAHKKEQRDPKHLFTFKKIDAYKELVNKTIDKIAVRNALIGKKYGKEGGTIKAEHKVAGGLINEGFIAGPALTPGETDTIKFIERKASKLIFDVGVRAMYISPSNKFDGPFGIGGCISNIKQFTSEGYNGLVPSGRWHSGFNGYPWEDYQKIRSNRQSRLALMAYKRRSYFYYPFKSKPVILNTEEIATMFHLPGSTASSPALDRVPSKKATPPTNLPV